MIINREEALAFDDVLLEPRHTDFPASNISFQTRLTQRLLLHIPIISAAMDTVTESEMAISIGERGGIGIIHRNQTTESQVSMVLTVKSTVDPLSRIKPSKLLAGAAIGTQEQDIERAAALIKAGVDVLVIDTAHGDSVYAIETIKAIKSAHPSIEIIAGNVASASAVGKLISAGANAIKVGVGPGSICTTRIVSGVGIPQLTAIMEVAQRVTEIDNSIPVIADGGIRNSGDIVKALAAGAHSVMLGSLLAGTIESAARTCQDADGQVHKVYRGMGSESAMRAGSADRYGQNATAKKLVPEGVEGTVACSGKVSDVITQLLGGVRSGMNYCGSSNIDMLQCKASFRRITQTGLVESKPHSLLKVVSR